MKRFKKIAFFAAIAALLCLIAAGCSNSDVQQNDVSIESTKVDTTLHTMMYSEMKEGQFTALQTYGEGEESYIFWCKDGMTQVGFYPVTYNFDTETFSRAGETVYVSANVPAGEALHAHLVIPEVVPDTVITYTAGGQVFEYALAYNGRTGGISLMVINMSDPSQSTTTSAETTSTETTTTTTEVTDTQLMENIVNDIAGTAIDSSAYNSITPSGAATVDGYVCTRYTVALNGNAVAYIAVNDTLMHSFVDFGCDGSYYYVLPDEDGFYYVNRDFEVIAE